MKSFDPVVEIELCSLLLDSSGCWPSFHDAEVYSVSFWSGDIRPDEDIWIGPQLTVALGIVGPEGETPFAVLRMQFLDCDLVELKGAGPGCAPFVYDLEFDFEERGFYADGLTPLSPYIRVSFSQGPNQEPFLAFRCMKVRAISREVPSGPPYA